jgi:hypothetical protein
MSRAALIIALAVAAVLAVTAAVLLRPPAGDADAAPHRFDPARVTSLSVTGPDASITFARDGSAWIFTLRRADGTGFAHHADAVKVQAGLAALAGAERLGESAAPDARGATVVEIAHAQATLRILVGATPLGGRVPLAVTRGAAPPVSFLAPLAPFQPLLDAASSARAASAWLDPAVFRWGGVPASITLAHGTTKARLDHVGRVWHLREPFNTHADNRAVGILQAAMANLKLSEASPAPAVPEPNPAFTISFVEAGPAGASYSLRGSSDGSGVAFLSGPLGDVRIVLRGPDLDLLTPKLTTLINHYASPFPAADITGLRVRPPGNADAPERVFTRKAEAWVLDETPLQGASLAAVSALARLLGDHFAQAVSIDPPTDFQPVATLGVDLRVSAPITFIVGTSVPPAAAAGGKPVRVLTLVAGPIVRLYKPEEGAAIVPFLSALVGEGAQGP